MQYGKLTLIRKPLESITIRTTYGEEIILSVSHVQGKDVALSIDAPIDTRITCTEVLDDDVIVVDESLA